MFYRLFKKLGSFQLKFLQNTMMLLSISKGRYTCGVLWSSVTSCFRKKSIITHNSFCIINRITYFYCDFLLSTRAGNLPKGSALINKEMVKISPWRLDTARIKRLRVHHSEEVKRYKSLLLVDLEQAPRLKVGRFYNCCSLKYRANSLPLEASVVNN